ncbi:glycerate kinase [Plodia interpunctella]|uniref:glycerate kinase n=1 Tax=Plodia interpunctella TaxID=58824 RepID=UPI002368CFD6|nr:glycerate kinase [Plodia interpunctella]
MAKPVICDLIQIFKSGITAVLPENLIRKSIKYNPVNQQLTIVNQNYNLQEKNLYLVGFGKAVQNMAIEVENILDSKIKEGIISVPVGSLVNKQTENNVRYYEGAQDNLPDAGAVSTAKKIRSLVTTLNENDLLLVLTSGGGSALLPLPKDPITLEEKTQLIKKLGNSGADITELNSVRKKISDVKGGQLAIKAQPAEVVSLILSDIVGDPLDLIASGPTTEDKDDREKALNIIKKYKLDTSLPPSITKVLEEETSNKFPKNRVRNHIIGSNKLSIAEAFNKAKELGYWPLVISNEVTGNVAEVAEEYVKLTVFMCQYLLGKLDIKLLEGEIKILKIPGLNIDFIEQLKDDFIKDKDLCLIGGGEITVEVKGNGKGGRNQQLALEFSNLIHKIKASADSFDVHFLSAGTDGIDGPTDAAGAIGHLSLILEANKEGIDVHKYIDTNDSYNFYRNYRKGELHVITGHTNTNVMDTHLIIIKRINK